MKPKELTVTQIGNSRGVRLPSAVLRRYGIGDTVLMEQRADEIVLRAKGAQNNKLSWSETYQQMAQMDEDWPGWETAGEGLREIPGENRK